MTDYTGMDAAAMFGDPASSSRFDEVQAAAERRNLVKPCDATVKAVRSVAPNIAKSANFERARAEAIAFYTKCLDAELHAIANRDLAADARRAGL